MLIQDFVQVKAHYATVHERLLEPTAGWLCAPPRASASGSTSWFGTFRPVGLTPPPGHLRPSLRTPQRQARRLDGATTCITR
jgi:hypothetical protein